MLLSRVNAHLQLYLYNQREEELRIQERIISYQNGLTEMGVAVLHNIGNAMVRVNSRISPIQGMVGKISDLGSALERAYSILDEEGDQQRVLQILELVAKLLKEEYATALEEESRNPKEAILQVNEIIDVQRNLTTKGLMSSSFRIDSLLADISMLLGSELKRRGVQLLMEGYAEMPELFLPRSPLGQVVINLVKNGLESISERIEHGDLAADAGQIRIEITLDEGEGEGGERYWWLEVVDNGVGLTAEQCSQAILTGYTTKPGRSGLGLHNAANFSISVGGRLTLESGCQGAGATVRLKLPVECRQNCYQLAADR